MMQIRRIAAALLTALLVFGSSGSAFARLKEPPKNAVAAAEQPFKGCALIGDSISDGLRIYASRQRKKDPSFLGGLEFLTATSYNLKYASASKPKKYLEYEGRPMRPQDALKAMGAGSVFIMLGMNDIFRDFEDSIRRYETLIGNIREKNPEIAICVLGITPVVKGKERSGFTNVRVDEFNRLLEEMALRLDCSYACFTDQLRDENGGLKPEYSSDKFVHLKGGAFEIYAQALEDALPTLGKSPKSDATFKTSGFTSQFES